MKPWLFSFLLLLGVFAGCAPSGANLQKVESAAQSGSGKFSFTVPDGTPEAVAMALKSAVVVSNSSWSHSGSGFVLAADQNRNESFVATNGHVVNAVGKEGKIVDFSGNVFDYTLIRNFFDISQNKEGGADIAFLKVSGVLAQAKIGAQPAAGSTVYFVGWPVSTNERCKSGGLCIIRSLTFGWGVPVAVAKQVKEICDSGSIQGMQGSQGETQNYVAAEGGGGYALAHCADQYKGQSGGPTLNERGEVVGMNGRQASLFGLGAYTAGSQTASNDVAQALDKISWSIPISTVLNFAERLNIPFGGSTGPASASNTVATKDSETQQDAGGSGKGTGVAADGKETLVRANKAELTRCLGGGGGFACLNRAASARPHDIVIDQQKYDACIKIAKDKDNKQLHCLAEAQFTLW